MRVLVTVWSVESHLAPVLPLVRALLDAGDEVLVATTPALAERVALAGARVEAVLRDPDGSRDPDEDDPATFPSPMSTAVAAMAADYGLTARTREVVELARRFGADLVVRDDSEFVGYLAAELLGLPVVCVAGAVSNAFPSAQLAPVIDTYRRRLGLPELDDPEGLYPGPMVDYVPAGFSVGPTDREVLRFRQPAGTEHGQTLPAGLDGADSDRPLVFAAIGSGWRTWRDQGVPGQVSPETIMKTLLGALSDVDCLALVSSGGMDVTQMERAGHVRVADFVPQRLVLQTTQLFCTHAGYNSVRESLRAGVPMLLSPSTLDQPANAAAVERCGWGSVVTGLDRDELATTVATALADSGLAGRIRAAQRAMLALPGVDTAPAALAAVSR